MAMDKLYRELESTLVMLLVSSDLTDDQRPLKPSEKRKQSRECLFEALTPFDHSLDDDCGDISDKENLDWLCRASLQSFAQGDFVAAKQYASKAHAIDDTDACVLLCCARLYSPSISGGKKNPKENRTKSLRFLGSCLTDSDLRNHPYTLLFAAHIYFIQDRLDDSCGYLRRASEMVSKYNQKSDNNSNNNSGSISVKKDMKRSECRTRLKECIADALCENYLEIYAGIDETENTEIFKLLCLILQCDALVENRNKALKEANQRAHYIVEQATLNDDYTEVAFIIPEIDHTLPLHSDLLEAMTCYWKPMRSQTERTAGLQALRRWIDTRHSRVKSADDTVDSSSSASSSIKPSSSTSLLILPSKIDIVQDLEELIMLYESRMELYREWDRSEDAEVDQISIVRMREQVARVRRKRNRQNNDSDSAADSSPRVSYPKLSSKKSKSRSDKSKDNSSKRKLYNSKSKSDDNTFNDLSVIDDDLDTASSDNGGDEEGESPRNGTEKLSTRDIRSGMSPTTVRTDETGTTVSGEFSLLSDSLINDGKGRVSKEQTPNLDYSMMSDTPSLDSGDISPMRDQRTQSKISGTAAKKTEVYSDGITSTTIATDSIFSGDISSIRSGNTKLPSIDSVSVSTGATSKEAYSQWKKDELISELMNVNSTNDQCINAIRDLERLLTISQSEVEKRNKIISEFKLENGDLRRMVSEQKRKITAIRDEARTAETTRIILKSAFAKPLSPLNLTITPQLCAANSRKVSEMSDQMYGILTTDDSDITTDPSQMDSSSIAASASSSFGFGKGCYQISTLVVSLFIGCLAFLLLCSVLSSSSNVSRTSGDL